MPVLNVIANQHAVNEYLVKHGLEHGNVPIDAVLLQGGGTGEGLGAVMIVVIVDGKRVVAKTTLRLLTSAVKALNACGGG